MLTSAVIFCLLFQSAAAIYLLGATSKQESFDMLIRRFLFVLLIHVSTKFGLLYFFKTDFLYGNVPAGFTLFYGPYLLVIANEICKTPLAKKAVFFHLLPVYLFSAIYFSLILLHVSGNLSNQQIIGYDAFYRLLVAASLSGYSYMIYHKLKHNPADSNTDYPAQKKLVHRIALVLLSGVLLGVCATALHWFDSLFTSISVRTFVYSDLLLIPLFVIKYKIQNNHKEVVSLSTAPVQQPVFLPLETPKKYQKSGVNDDLFTAYEEKILKHMKKSKVYLNPELTLEELAKQVSIPRHHLTQTLNDKLGKTFYQFINEYRIEDAIIRLKKSKDDVSMLSLAYDVGFNSKSSFNSYFKKITGHTPSAYRKNILLIEEAE